MNIQGDETLLRTALENLLGNASKYAEKNPRATIEFCFAANGADSTHHVRDDGVGFSL